MSVITIVGITLGVLIAVCVTWLGFPGTFLIAIVALIWGWMTDYHSITVGVILALFGVSILLEIMELLKKLVLMFQIFLLEIKLRIQEYL